MTQLNKYVVITRDLTQGKERTTLEVSSPTADDAAMQGFLQTFGPTYLSMYPSPDNFVGANAVSDNVKIIRGKYSFASFFLDRYAISVALTEGEADIGLFFIIPDTAKCQCDVCQESRYLCSVMPDFPFEAKSIIEDLRERLMHAEMDRDVAESKLDGNWPGYEKALDIIS